MKIDFIIVGVARCGTTSLYHYLNQHPEIAFSRIKEPKYFSSINKKFPHKGPGDDTVDANVVKDFSEYLRLFKKTPQCKVIGEASSDYFYFHKKTIPEIKKTFGANVKIIISIRNPIDRSFSAYNNLVRDSRETSTFYDGLMKEQKRIKENFDWMWHYANGSLYYEGILSFIKNFNEVKIILMDDLDNHPSKTLKDIFKFLNVNNEFMPNFSQKFSTSGKPVNVLTKFLSSRTGFVFELRKLVISIFPRSILEIIARKMFKKEKIDLNSIKFLREFFSDDIKKTEKLINKNLKKWIN